MRGEAFFDSNVLLYLLSSEQHKAERAEVLLKTGGIISVQVLNEFTVNARRKFGLGCIAVDEFIDAFRAAFRIVPLTEPIWNTGRHLAERYQLQVYDAMIAAAALESGASTLYSEDLHDGLLIEGRLKVRNPFA